MLFTAKFDQEIEERNNRNSLVESHYLNLTDAGAGALRPLMETWVTYFKEAEIAIIRRKLLNWRSFFDTVDEIKTGYVLHENGVACVHDHCFNWQDHNGSVKESAPDWSEFDDQGKPSLIVEVVRKNLSEEEFERRKKVARFQKKLGEIKVPLYAKLTILDLLQFLSTPKKDLLDEVAKWLSTEQREAKFEGGGVRLDHWGTHKGKNLLVVAMGSVDWVNPENFRATIKRKVTHYHPLLQNIGNPPYVIGIGASLMTGLSLDILVDFFYGQEAYIVNSQNEKVAPARLVGGYFEKHASWVSGVLWLGEVPDMMNPVFLPNPNADNDVRSRFPNTKQVQISDS